MDPSMDKIWDHKELLTVPELPMELELVTALKLDMAPDPHMEQREAMERQVHMVQLAHIAQSAAFNHQVLMEQQAVDMAQHLSLDKLDNLHTRQKNK